MASVEMVRGLSTGLYPNLIQNAFFTSSVLIMGQAKALEPEAWVKQRLWSH